MKLKRNIHIVLAVAVLGLTATLAGLAVAENLKTFAPPRPLLVKNGPPGWGGGTLLRLQSSPVYWPMSGGEQPDMNKLMTDRVGALSFKSPSGGPTNLLLQAFLVDVNADGDYILTNSLAGPATNYFATPAGAGYFNGDSTISLTAGGTWWDSVDFVIKSSEFQTNNTGDSLLLFLGQAAQGTNDYDSIYVYSVGGPESSTNFCTPIVTASVEKIIPGTENSFYIWGPGSTNFSTNMVLRSYLANVTTNVTGGETNLVLVPPANAPGGNLPKSSFETNSGYYVGTNTVYLRTNGLTEVKFKLKASSFANDMIEDCWIIFVGTATNAYGKCETAYAFPVDSPYTAP